MKPRKKVKTGEKKEPIALVAHSATDGETVDGVSGMNNSTLVAKSQASRTRVYAFIVYPDSAPANWREILIQAHVEVLISPLHDKDVNPDGTLKKPHYHVMVIYSSVKTVEQAQAIRDSVGGVGWENVASTRGYARYLIHADNPEKAQYKREDVVELGGADYDEIIRRNADGIKALREMMDYIREHNVMWYADFVEYCLDENDEWFELIGTRYAYAIREYIKGRYVRKRGVNGIYTESYGGEYVDPTTGEIIKE